jgi:ligand-binding SRPBCC domain-containing protein
MYTLEKLQKVRTTLDVAWNFLKNPSNLNRITPEDLHFQIVSEVPEEMYNGLVIEYRIKIPYLGVRNWITEIKHIDEHHAFVDEQRLGPYSFWYHYHELIEQGQDVIIVDRVHYEVPWGMIGKLIHTLFIRKTLERIFNFRQKRLEEVLTAQNVKIP